MPTAMTPRDTVTELDRFIIGQEQAKKAVAVALRNRWRRRRLEGPLKDEVLPKNILMVGPTGCGKTEIARRLAKLAEAPFLKVEATKFTEVGYVGRDVEQIIRDLVEAAVGMAQRRHREQIAPKAVVQAEERLLKILVGADSREETRERFRHQLRTGSLDEAVIDVQLRDSPAASMPMIDIPGMPGAGLGLLNLGDMMDKALGGGGGRTRSKRMTVAAARSAFLEEATDDLINKETIAQEARRDVEQNGIVFIDEIDKITVRSDHRGGDISREGVQRDLLPLLEGTTVATRYGAVQTDHILFITSGAFHQSRPSDLLAELQGRLPIRVQLQPLLERDFARILREPENSLIRQYVALLQTESVTLTFDDAAIDRIAALAAQINRSVENIGARRLHTILERLLEEINFTASERSGETIRITADLVDERVADLARDSDLSRFIL